MLDHWVRKTTWTIVLVMLGMLWFPVSAWAAFYDATGRWAVTYTPTESATAPEAGCLPAHFEPFVVTLAQDGDTFTLSKYGEVLESGTIGFDEYRAASSSREIVFILNSETQGDGTLTTTWPNPLGGTCTASGSLSLYRAMNSAFQASGSWKMQVNADVLDTTLSGASCAISPARTVQVDIIQSNNAALISLDSASARPGDVDGGYVTFMTADSGTWSQESAFRFLQTNQNSATGNIHWVRSDGTTMCVGTNAFSMTRQDAGSIDLSTALSVAPMNMMVGNTRRVSVEHATGTPNLYIAPESGVVTMTTVSGVTSLTCDAPGTATLTVTDVSGAATALVNCIAAGSGSSGESYQLADWIFLNDVTLVAQNFWQSNQTEAWDSHGLRWSRAGGTADFLDRGVVSTLVGDDVQYYSLDANGLTFHGESRYDVTKDEATRFVQYGFVNPPALDFGIIDIQPEHVALANLTAPAPLLPATVPDGYSSSATRIEYRLDANNQLLDGQWVVLKREITVTGHVNLMDEVLPEGLQTDVEFKSWRDSITDLDLLNQLTHVLRIRLVETRYLPGSTIPTVEAGTLYLAQGVGLVYEQWQESEGVDKQFLVAKESGSGLVSVTNRAIVAKRFRIDAPAGVTLETPFVQLRVEHDTGLFAAAPHSHEVVGSYNQTPGTNSALLTLYARTNSPTWDSTSVVNLTYGAKGFERQIQNEVAIDSMADPMVLTLSAANQGQAMQWLVKDEAGTLITQARLRIAPYQNNACDESRSSYHELSSSGSVTVTLAPVPHCLEIWPVNSGDFIGGFYDASVLLGLVNVVAPGQTGAGLPFTLLPVETQTVLVVARDDIPDHNRVSGILTDGNNLLANVEVLAFPEGGRTPLVTRTDTSGAFVLDLPEGSYSLAFRYVNGGLVYQAYLADQSENNTLSTTPGVTHGLFADTLLGQLALTSTFKVNTATLSGVVVNGSSGQLNGPVDVSVMSTTAGGYVAQTQADASGAFSVQVPVNGDYFIRVTARGAGLLYRGYVDGYGVLSASQTALSPVTVYGATSLNLTLTDAMSVATYAVTGQVTDNAATPVGLAGVTLRAIDSATQATLFETVTDAQGQFSLAVTSGSYQFEIIAREYQGGLVSGTASAVTLVGRSAAQTYLVGTGTGAVASLILNPVLARSATSGGGDPGISRIVVTGLATSSQGALQNMLVEFQPDWENNTGFVDQAAVKTDSTGHYTASIYPGLYRVFFRAEYWDAGSGQMVKVPGVLGQGGFADGFGQATGQEESAKVFDLTVNSQVDVAFSSGVQVVGQVTDSAGQAIQKVKVEFQPETETDPWVETVTDASGNYSAFVKPGATYRVYFNTDYWDWTTQTAVKTSGLSGFAYDSANQGVTGDGQTAKKYTLSDKTTLNVTLASGLTIHGVVTSDGLHGVEGVLVRLQPEWDPSSGQAGTWGEVVTDATGQYSLTVQPGQYRVEFLTSYWQWEQNQQKTVAGNLIGGFANGSGGISNDWMAARIFQVSDATEINAQLRVGRTLSGTVTTSDGTAVVGAEVNVHTQDWTSFFRAKTGQDGAFSIVVTPGLDYQVEVWPAYCAAGNTDASVGCGVGHLEFLGGNWITPPDDTTWVQGWQADDPASQPLVQASLVVGVVPGQVMAQSDSHVVTNLRLDQSLVIAVQVGVGTQVRGRVVDEDGQGVPWAWVDSDFGSGPADQDGFFALNIPATSATASVNNAFAIRIFPGGYQDPVSNAWVKGSNFIGGVVTGNSEIGFTLTGDDSLATPFASNLEVTDETHLAWPQLDLHDEASLGLLVRVSRGLSIIGTVKSGTQGVANLWVNAWSHDGAVGGGGLTQSNGDYAIQVPTPAPGTSAWYEVSVWSDQYLAPEPMLVKVEAPGVVGVYAIDKEASFENDTGAFKPVPVTEATLADPRGGVPVNFALSTGNTISGRVTDSSNKGLAWVWVDLHSKDQSKWYGASTDENGYYSVKVEPADNYIGVVWGVNGQYRTQFYKNATQEENATLIDASGSTSPTHINFSMSSGAKITGSILGLSAGQKLWLNAWSDSQRNWSGTEVAGSGAGTTAVSFEIKGLALADDYRLDWSANSDVIPNGYYGGVPGSGVASGPKGSAQSTRLSTMNGQVTGVDITLAVVTKTLSVKVDRLLAGSKVDADVRSEKLHKGRWKQATANAAGVAIIELKGLENSDDYQLFVGGPGATFKVGHFMGTVSEAGYPATSGSLVGWDRATKINMAADQFVSVSVASGRQLTVQVSGLLTGQKAWVDAFSETTQSMNGGQVVYGNGTTDQVVIKGLEAADDYRVSIWSPQIMGGSYTGDGKSPGSWETAELVDVSASDKTITMAVSSGRSIAGSVTGLSTSQTGWVDAWSNSTFSWGGASVQGAGASTAVNYSLAGLGTAADFQVTFNAPGFVPQKKTSQSTLAGNLTGVNFTASTGGSIKGSISGLKAFEWVRVDAWSPTTDSFIMGGTAADSAGAATYTLSGVPDASDYVVGVWRGDMGLFYATTGVTPVWDNHSKVTVSGSGTTSGIDFNLTAAGTLFYSLSGTISGLSSSQVVEVRAWSNNAGASTTVTGNSTFTLEGLPAGSYSVEVFSNGYIPQRTKSVMVASNQVSAVTWTSGWNDVGTVAIAGNTTGLNITLSTGYSIKGSVKNSSNAAVSGAWVNAWSESAHVGGGALTNSLGEFTIKGLPGGSVTYKVDVWTPEGSGNASVTVANANQTGVALTIGKATGSITGTVSGTAAAGALVLAYDSTGAEKRRALANATTGAYTLDDLTPDQVYTIKVFSATKVKAGTWSDRSSGYAEGSVTATTGGATLNLTLN